MVLPSCNPDLLTSPTMKPVTSGTSNNRSINESNWVSSESVTGSPVYKGEDDLRPVITLS